MSNLKEIGFKVFEHLDKSKRDGIERMIWSGVYKNELVGIQIVKSEKQLWVFDKVLFNSNKEEIFNNYFRRDKSLENVLKFIKSNSAKN